MGRRKSLLIGINYTGSQNELQGCIDDTQNVRQFLLSRGFPSDQNSMVVMTDQLRGPMYPDGHNILAAMDWLVSEPGCSLFLQYVGVVMAFVRADNRSYSGHGGQVRDPDGDRASGFDDTIVPVGSPVPSLLPISLDRAHHLIIQAQVDFERNGQISSDTLHKHLVSALPRNSVLHILFDCCHSGSAVELPFVYRTDDDGNVNLVDNLKEGFALVGEATNLIQGGLRFDRMQDAEQLYAGATSFFKGLMHQGGGGEEGLQKEDFEEDWSHEGKSVFMLSGCKDDQTSADAFIAGKHVGAMSWSFLETMRTDRNWDMSYIQILKSSRQLLQQKYQQIPQLSCGYQFDLNKPLRL